MSRGDPVAKFRCPNCGDVTVSTVCNSNPTAARKRLPDDLIVKRWRRCHECGERFSTTESVDVQGRLLKHRSDQPRLPM
jgi:transcriptional regulator NrdR family protein